MDLKIKQKLINEFIYFEISGDKPYFNFTLKNGMLKSYNNIIDFLINEPKLDYKKIYVTPF